MSKSDLSPKKAFIFEVGYLSEKSEQIENVTFQALSHHIRRAIVRMIQTRDQGISYTELITELGIPTGKLNYHLDQLKGLIEKNGAQHYVLTPFGKKAEEHLNLIEQKISSEDEKYVRLSALSQKASLQPIVRAFLILGIVVSLIIISIWGIVAYMTVLEGVPVMIYILLSVLIIVGVSLLATLLYALIRTPRWIKRLEQKYFGDKGTNFQG